LTQILPTLIQVRLINSRKLPNKYGEISPLHPSSLFQWHPSHQQRNREPTTESVPKRNRKRCGGLTVRRPRGTSNPAEPPLESGHAAVFSLDAAAPSNVSNFGGVNLPDAQVEERL
jgi:hypothetical protein